MMDPSKKYKPSLGFQQCFEAEMRKLVLMSNLLTSSSSSTSLCAPADDSDTEMKDVIQTPDPVHQIFVTTPPEIILEIYSYLNPIDTICFSLINKFTLNVYLEHLQSTNHPRPSLSLGSPSSPAPPPQTIRLSALRPRAALPRALPAALSSAVVHAARAELLRGPVPEVHAEYGECGRSGQGVRVLWEGL
ncbi:hypothetical protein ACMFMG_004358 [Clarireedia jacksonii]